MSYDFGARGRGHAGRRSWRSGRRGGAGQFYSDSSSHVKQPPHNLTQQGDAITSPPLTIAERPSTSATSEDQRLYGEGGDAAGHLAGGGAGASSQDYMKGVGYGETGSGATSNPHRAENDETSKASVCLVHPRKLVCSSKSGFIT